MLALNDFSFEFAGRYLFKNASWHIKPNEKIGLVGLNGTGKSTLLRLISSDFELREGTLSRPSDLRIGFLNQDLLSMDVGDCVRDVVLSGREDLVHLEVEINRLIEKIEVEYFIVKRKLYEQSEYSIPRTQHFKPASGKNKRKQAVDNLNNFIKDCFDESGKPQVKSYIKNVGESSCKWCPYKDKPELCDKIAVSI